MIGARKGPQVPLKLLQEFHLNYIFFGGHEIAESYFQIERAERGRFRQQLVARAGSEHHEIRPAFFSAGHQAHLRAVCIHAGHARTHRGAARSDGAVKQQAIENLARVDDDGMAHLESGAMPAAGNQLRSAHDFFWLRPVEQEGIGFDGLMGEAAAAGFLPGETLVENGDAETAAGKALPAKRAGGSASDNRDVFHGPGDDPMMTRMRSAENAPALKLVEIIALKIAAAG